MKYMTCTGIALTFLLTTHLVQADNLERLFAPKAELWETWAAHSTNSTDTILHQEWTMFLQQHLSEDKDGINRVKYSSVSKADTLKLKQYLTRLSQVKISQYSRSQQLPYWINLYNALTIDVVLQHYPVASIRDIDISPGFFSDGPWDKKLLSIQGEMLSLNDIEHRILRPIWQDTRIHYALNCASIGCPNLQIEAYTVENIDTLLRKALEDYINHPRGVKIIDGQLQLSSIYNWFQGDFGDYEKDVLDHIRAYAQPDLRQNLTQFDSIDNYTYDWSLNDAASSRH